MSNTGARPDQIEAAAEAEWRARGGVALKRWDELCDEAKAGCYEEMHEHASYLCPVGSALIDAEDVAAIRRVVQRELEDRSMIGPGMSDADLDRLRRIGGEA